MHRLAARSTVVWGVAAVVWLPGLAMCAETWRLGDSGQWQQVAGSKEEEFLLRVAQIKKVVDAGKAGEVKKLAKKLKADYPDVAGKDFDVFIEGEVLLAKGKLSEAVRKYEKLLDEYPKSGLRDAALTREFDIASEYLAGRKKRVLMFFRFRSFEEGIKTMEKISDREGNAEIARRASLAVVEHYEKRQKYAEAYLKWSEISTRWPTGETGRDALLGMAKSKYASYRGSEYDGSSLISARSYYENFRLRYPDEAKGIGAEGTVARIDEQMAEKNLGVARYYERTGNPEGANLYYRMVAEKWPDSEAGRAAKEKLNQKPDIKKQNEE